MKDTISIVVADDHPLFREGVVKTLSNEPSLNVVAQAASADEVIALVVDHLPDIALLDINMPGDGLRAAREIALRCPVVRVVMLTVAEDEDIVNAALRAGALGYVLKGVSGPELVRVLNAVHRGEAYITPALAGSLLRSMPTPENAADPLAPLTARERDILEHLAEGASNKQIAGELHIAERTVKHHMTNILQKLHVKNRVEAALVAVRDVNRE